MFETWSTEHFDVFSMIDKSIDHKNYVDLLTRAGLFKAGITQG